MKKKPGKKGVKNLVATAKKAANTAAKQDTANATTLATVADAKLLAKSHVPPMIEDKVYHGVSDAFSPRLVKVLQSPDVKSFFGRRLKSDEIVKAVQTALTYEAIAQRMTHSASVAQRIAAPAEALLLEQAALIVSIAPDLLAENSDYQDPLNDLFTWWTKTFPGGGPKPANNGGDGSGQNAPQDQKKAGAPKTE